MSSRRALLESLLSRLPSAFQEVEYIESSGTQYIDTDVNVNNNLRVVSRFNVTQNADNCIFGGRLSTNDSQFCFLKLPSNPYEFRTDYGNTTGYKFGGNVNTWYKIDKDKNITYLDDQVIHTDNVQTFNTNIPLYIFARNTNGTINAYAYLQIAYLQIYDNGTLVRDFIPCYRKSDNEIGLYDLVNGVFYTNAGTGTFTKGGNV